MIYKTPKFMLTVWVIALLMFRPSYLGETYGAFVFISFILISIYVIVYYYSKNVRFKFVKTDITILKLVILFSLYIGIQGLVLSSAKSIALKALFGIPIVSLFFIYIARGSNLNYIFKVFITIHLFLSISIIISNLLIFINSMDISPFVIAHFVWLKENQVNLIFPFSLSWSKNTLSDQFFLSNVHRFIGFYREPGEAQYFFLTAYFLLFFIKYPYGKIVKYLIWLGGLFLFSTQFVFSWIFGALLLYIFQQEKKRQIKKAILLITAVLSIYLFTNFDYGLISKIETGTGADRIIGFQISLNKFFLHPIFGEGYYNNYSENRVGSTYQDIFTSIGLLGPLYQLGLFGILLYILCWTYALVKRTNSEALSIYVPFLITMMLSEPSYNNIFAFFLMTIDTRNLRLIKYEKKNSTNY